MNTPAPVEHFPIRVVSARTGINAVTLRAWERRYGLLRPLRTAKGHRLYSGDDIARIERIVAWLERGMSIGRVRDLLERDEEQAGVPADAGVHSGWEEYRVHVSRAIAGFDEKRLDETVGEALSLYPFATVCERLLLPSAHESGVRRHTVPGTVAEQAFFDGWLRRKLSVRMQLAMRHLHGLPVLIGVLPVSQAATDLPLLVLATGLTGMEIPVVLLETPLPAEEWLVVMQQRPAAALVLYGDSAQETAALSRMLARLVPGGVPVALAGPAARIHETLAREQHALALTAMSPAAAARRLALYLGREHAP